MFPKSVKKDSAGYLPLDGVMTPAYLSGTPAVWRYQRIKANKVPEEKGIVYFNEVWDIAAKLNIKTVVVISPTILKNPFVLDNQSIEKQLVIDNQKIRQRHLFRLFIRRAH